MNEIREATWNTKDKLTQAIKIIKNKIKILEMKISLNRVQNQWSIQEIHHQGQISPLDKVWKEVFQGNGPKMQAGAVIFISDKTGFKPKTTRRDREGHYKLIKEKKSAKRIFQF